jgi:hypothetical protein
MTWPVLIVALLGGIGPAAADAPSLRVVNVTSDSAPGWVPSEALEQQARATAVSFLAAEDQGRYADAYALLADLDKRDQPFATFQRNVAAFNTQAGAVRERRIVTVTWTKTPPTRLCPAFTQRSIWPATSPRWIASAGT